jgi:hypothetical protein
MKTTVGSRILKIILKILMVWTIISPFLVFYEPYFRLIHLDHFVLWQRALYFAMSVAMSVGMVYIISLGLQLINTYQQGEFFTTASNTLVKYVIHLLKWYLFIAVLIGMYLQYIIPQPITMGGITAPQFGLVSILSSMGTYLIQYAVLSGLGALHTRECRAREEANLTV